MCKKYRNLIWDLSNPCKFTVYNYLDLSRIIFEFRRFDAHPPGDSPSLKQLEGAKVRWVVEISQISCMANLTTNFQPADRLTIR